MYVEITNESTEGEYEKECEGIGCENTDDVEFVSTNNDSGFYCRRCKKHFLGVSS